MLRALFFLLSKSKAILSLAAGNRTGTVRLWQVESGRSLQSLQGLVGAVTGLAFSPDGSLVAAGTELGRSLSGLSVMIRNLSL